MIYNATKQVKESRLQKCLLYIYFFFPQRGYSCEGRGTGKRVSCMQSTFKQHFFQCDTKHSRQGRCCSFSFRDQKTAWFAIWESGALQSLQKSLAFFSHCFQCVNALIMRGAPQCCTCSYSVDQREVLLSSFTFSVSWWLRLANKL